jgi:hypothetical protein
LNDHAQDESQEGDHNQQRTQPKAESTGLPGIRFHGGQPSSGSFLPGIGLLRHGFGFRDLLGGLCGILCRSSLGSDQSGFGRLSGSHRLGGMGLR